MSGHMPTSQSAGQSSWTKESWSKTLLKHCTNMETRWNKKSRLLLVPRLLTFRQKIKKMRSRVIHGTESFDRSRLKMMICCKNGAFVHFLDIATDLASFYLFATCKTVLLFCCSLGISTITPAILVTSLISLLCTSLTLRTKTMSYSMAKVWTLRVLAIVSVLLIVT